MAKGTMLDRLAEAMQTLGKRQGKALTPRQRVAAAQRWNSMADIGELMADRAWDVDRNEFHKVTDELERLGLDELPKAPPEVAERLKHTSAPLAYSYDINRLDNPFLSDNLDKYSEQSDFLDWCRYKDVEPNARSLKQYRWETYQTLPYREQQWIANKDAIRQGVQDEGFVPGYVFTDDLKTLRGVDDATRDYQGVEYDFMELPVYKSYEEFPDDFDYMWRY